MPSSDIDQRGQEKPADATGTSSVRAALRDASWYRRPSTHGKDLVYHVVLGEVHREEGACGTPVIATEGFAPARDMTIPAEEVAEQHRCRRPGCRARWPKLG